MHDAVVLLSGGLDSLVVLAVAAREHDVLALTFDYGQMAGESEIRAAASIARHYHATHTTIELNFLRGGALTGAGKLPEPTAEQLSTLAARESARAVWVPARNLVFCSIAASIAERIGAHTVFIGANAEEGETFPDNTERFVESLNHTLRHATLHRVDVKAPVMGRTKSEIVKLGCELGVPFEFSWSCYRSLDVPCGRCESCMRRKRAFEKAGIHDPLEMRV